MNVKHAACALGSITLAALVPAALLVVALLVAQPALAQSVTGEDVKPVAIQAIDVSAFPFVTVTAAVRGAAQQQVQQVRVLEDGSAQDADPMIETGGPLAVAILLDLSPLAQEEMGNITSLVRDFTTQLPTDTLYALYQATEVGPRSEKLPSAYSGPFYPDRGALLNHLSSYTPDGPDNTPLLEMVQAIQTQFPANSSGRHIVVFTGPVASSGKTDVGTVQAGCQEGIQVHAVLIAQDRAAAGNTDMLENMTTACKGANTLYKDPNSAISLRQLMGKAAELVTLAYRTHQSKPRYLKVEIPDGNNGFHVDGREFPQVKDVRVSIDIKSPAVGAVFTSSQPIQLDVEAAVTPYALRIAKVEYAIDGGPMLPLAESDTGFSATLPQLEPGQHKLVVQATDELGNRNVDEVARNVTIDDVVEPPPPPPLWIGFMIALAVLIVLAVLSALAWKWWRGRPRAQDLAAAPAFQLVLAEPLPRAPKTIALDSETIILGRDAAYATNVLEDDRISRRQCTISSSRGKFLVQNNSATNATLLNGQKLKKDGRAFVLKRGDVLTLGPAKYRFDVVGAVYDANLTRDMNALKNPALTVKMPEVPPPAQQAPGGQLSPIAPVIQSGGLQPTNGQPPAVNQTNL